MGNKQQCQVICRNCTMQLWLTFLFHRCFSVVYTKWLECIRFMFDLIYAMPLDLDMIWFCASNTTWLSLHLSKSCRPLLEPWATPPKLSWDWGSSVVLTSSYRGPKPIILHSKEFHHSIWSNLLPLSILQICAKKLNQLCLVKKKSP